MEESQLTQDIGACLQDIVARVQALEQRTVNSTLQNRDGPHDKVHGNCSFPHLTSETTPHALPLLCGVPAPLAN